MARGRVTMQINTAGRFEYAVQFCQAYRHHGEVRHHVVGAKK